MNYSSLRFFLQFLCFLLLGGICCGLGLLVSLLLEVILLLSLVHNDSINGGLIGGGGLWKLSLAALCHFVKQGLVGILEGLLFGFVGLIGLLLSSLGLGVLPFDLCLVD